MQLNFDADKTLYVKKAHNQLMQATYGSGQIFWSGLPLEQAHSSEVTRQIYQRVTAITARQTEESPLLVIKQPLNNGSLVLIISESSYEEQVEIAAGLTVSVQPERAGAIVLIDGQEAQFFGGVLRSSH